jgi:hypothetical protein
MLLRLFPLTQQEKEKNRQIFFIRGQSLITIGGAQMHENKFDYNLSHLCISKETIVL